MLSALRHFLKLEAASGILLFLAAVLAMIVANSPLAPWYGQFLDLPVAVRIGPLEIAKPLLLWINDGLMAVFFLLVGLEIKREVVEGELSQPSQVALPIAGAVGGMAVPALVYAAINWGNPVALHGWAIPAATDIAFSLGVLAVLGRRVPLALKVFLTTLAIVDDLGAIVVIAVFYTGQLSAEALAVAALCVAVLAILNASGVRRIGPYAVVGVVLWVSVLQSGVHATLAGVVLAMFIPLRVSGVADEKRPAIHLEHALKPWSAWLIMPAFAFANAGLSLADLSLGSLFEPIPLGIMAGLFVGKQVGIVLGAALLILSGMASMPAGGSWRTLYGVSILGGIGFTMSLFIGTLAFSDPRYEAEVRLGVLAGSVLSAVVGYLVLRLGKQR